MHSRTAAKISIHVGRGALEQMGIVLKPVFITYKPCIPI
jgi:hypothetical protein